MSSISKLEDNVVATEKPLCDFTKYYTHFPNMRLLVRYISHRIDYPNHLHQNPFTIFSKHFTIQTDTQNLICHCYWRKPKTTDIKLIVFISAQLFWINILSYLYNVILALVYDIFCHFILYKYHAEKSILCHFKIILGIVKMFQWHFHSFIGVKNEIHFR